MKIQIPLTIGDDILDMRKDSNGVWVKRSARNRSWSEQPRMVILDEVSVVTDELWTALENRTVARAQEITTTLAREVDRLVVEIERDLWTGRRHRK